MPTPAMPDRVGLLHRVGPDELSFDSCPFSDGTTSATADVPGHLS